MNTLLNKILNGSVKPPIFTPSTNRFWDDEYISKQMLNAHLSQDTDAASRKLETVQQTVRFLSSFFDMNNTHKILDLGCGPGLYCREFLKYSKHITGLDFSKNSIEYAKNHSNNDINYVLSNYIEDNIKGTYDFIFMIYYDFCVLSPSDTSVLLNKIYNALTDDGYFVLDILSLSHKKEIKKLWNINTKGFWRENLHLVLEETFYYETEQTYLDQYTVVDGNQIDIYRNYEKLYSLSSIKKLLSAHHLEVAFVWSDLLGNPYDETSKTLALAVKKVK